MHISTLVPAVIPVERLRVVEPVDLWKLLSVDRQIERNVHNAAPATDGLEKVWSGMLGAQLRVDVVSSGRNMAPTGLLPCIILDSQVEIDFLGSG